MRSCADSSVTASIKMPGRALLREHLVRILEFALEHVPRLAVHARQWEAEENDGLVKIADKVLAETAILALLASRVGSLGQRGDALLPRLVHALDEAHDSERIAGILLRCPQAAAPLGLTQAVLSRFGRGSRELEAQVRQIFADGTAETLERIPYRAMEVRWVGSLLGTHSQHSAMELLGLNVLSSPAHPITMDRETAYAMTHGVMYATDFGQLSLDQAGLDISVARARIDAALAWVIVNEDLDLLIELIISASLFRRPWSPYSLLGWDLWTTVWSELQFLPSPSFDTRTFGSMAGERATAYAFRHVYHTNYVSALLCAILLAMPQDGLEDPWIAPALETSTAVHACETAVRKASMFARQVDESNGAPAKPLEATRAIAVCEGLLSEMLPTHSRARTVLRQSQIEPSLLAAVMADATIIHAARTYDLPKLFVALSTSSSVPGPPSLTVLEGLRFIVRQQFQDGCIGLHFLASQHRQSAMAREATSLFAANLERCAQRLAAAA